MFATRLLGAVLTAALVPAAAPAAEFDGSKKLLCALVDAVECGSAGACVEETLEVFNVPRFIQIDFAAGRVHGKRPDGSEIDSPLGSKTNVDGALILQGAENGRGWSATIAEDTGKMTVAIAGEDVAFVVFGACTALE